MIKFKLLFLTIFLLFSQLGFSQTQSVSGTVKDANGSPIPGANVLVVGTNRGTITDFDGIYTIAVSPNEQLRFSFIGYIDSTVDVGIQNVINVGLQEAESKLDEIIVTGYSKQSTRDITGSVSVIKSEDLATTSPTSLEQSLQGQASGVVVNLEGGPGGSSAIRIRGYGTINGNDPLFIIDGTPTAAGLNSINPNDVESIQILKDASSAAVYGNRAANGVVIITTKSGKRNNKTTFTANAYVGVDFVPSSVFPDFATPQQLADAIWQAELNTTGTTPNHPQFGNGATPILPDYLWPQGTSGDVDESTYNYLTNPITRANKQGTDWFGEFFDPATIQSYNVSASGGGENSNHFLSLSALNQEGVALETSFTRYTLRANSNYSITPSFRIGQNVTVSYSDRIGIDGNQDVERAISSLTRINPIVPVLDVGGNFAGSGVGGLGNGRNPIAVQDRNKDNHDLGFRAFGNIFTEYDLLEDLTYKSSLGFDLNTFNSSSFNPFHKQDESPEANSLDEFSSLERVYTWFNTLEYQIEVGKHNFNALAGTEFNKRNFRQFGANRGGFLFNDPLNTRYLDLGTNNINNFGNGLITAYWSVFGKIDYKFDDTYLFSGTLRYDSSSVFTSDNRSGVFPAVSLGWRASNEDFLKDSNIFTDLLFKAGYGQIGNDGTISPNATADIFAPNLDFNAYPIGNNSLAIGNGLISRGNPNLTWEVTTTINAGFSARLFQLFNLDFEYFDTTTEDMLLAVPEDPTVFGNVNSITKNFGEMSNKGFDISTSYDNTTSGGFTYSIGANLSHYDNEVKFLDPTNLESFIDGAEFRTHRPNRTQAGQPLASFFGKKFLGIGADGRMEFEDINGDGVVNNDDQAFIGSPHPDFTYGINFNAEYRNFDLSLLIQGSQGNDIYNFMKFFSNFNTFPGSKSVDFVTENGLPDLTNDPNLILRESAQSSYFVEDGSYTRLKNVQLGYSLPDSAISRLGMSVSKIRFYLQGKNLITMTGYDGIDPEISLSSFSGAGSNLTIGVDSGAFPISRSLLFGLNVTF